MRSNANSFCILKQKYSLLAVLALVDKAVNIEGYNEASSDGRFKNFGEHSSIISFSTFLLIS